MLSNIYSNWGSASGLKLQFINVLCQIAFGYVLCFLITRLEFRWQVAAAVAMLAGYWALFAIFPGPDGPWSQTGNIGAVIDLKLLGYNYSGYYTTINFIGNAVTILFGCWAGALLRTDRSHAYKLRVLAACAAAGFALGLALQPFNPMVKRLWTDSFTFFSAGWVILMLMAFYWVIEVRTGEALGLPLPRARHEFDLHLFARDRSASRAGSIAACRASPAISNSWAISARFRSRCWCSRVLLVPVLLAVQAADFLQDLTAQRNRSDRSLTFRHCRCILPSWRKLDRMTNTLSGADFKKQLREGHPKLGLF